MIKRFIGDLQDGKYWLKFKKYFIDSALLMRTLKYIDIKMLINDLIQEQIQQCESNKKADEL